MPLRVIHLVRKPVDKSIHHNVLTWGTGSINIDLSRVPYQEGESPSIDRRTNHKVRESMEGRKLRASTSQIFSEGGNLENYTADREGELQGRWPSNVILDGQEVVDDIDRQSGPMDAMIGHHRGRASRYFKQLGR